MTTLHLTQLEIHGLAEAMEKKYNIYLDGRRFSIEAPQIEDGVMVRTKLSSDDLSYVYPVEARMAHKEEDLEPRKALLFLIDFVDAYFEDFLTSMESVYLPIDWADMSYEGIKFQIKGQILNKKAEDMADALLAADKPYVGPNIIV